ncbi:hypothetical protein AX16_006940 [Volvariella volvacea WC 439]|nr:hypothetical protein AX16_006940 [Volvariella volvacea WC 439]
MATSSPDSFFKGAHNFELSGEINNIHGNYTVYAGSNADPITVLLNASAREAMHDADRNDLPPPSAHPSTRRKIIKEFKEWMEEPDRTKNVLWVNGPPGSGKTTIARIVLDLLESKQQLAGTFFFDLEDSRRDKTKTFIPTIAYQLAMWHDGIMKDKILEAVKNNPAILSARLETQWRKLVLEPIRAITEELPPAVLIIDALDQCGGPTDQLQILNLIASCGSNFPIAFLITSLPENHLVAAFKKPPLSAMCRKQITLDDTLAAQREVEEYLTRAFESLRSERGSAARRNLSPDDLRDIVSDVASNYTHLRHTAAEEAEIELLDENERLESDIRRLRTELEQLRAVNEELKQELKQKSAKDAAATQTSYIPRLRSVVNKVRQNANNNASSSN